MCWREYKKKLAYFLAMLMVLVSMPIVTSAGETDLGENSRAGQQNSVYVAGTCVNTAEYWLVNSNTLTSDGASVDNYDVRYIATENRLV